MKKEKGLGGLIDAINKNKFGHSQHLEAMEKKR